MQDHECSEHNIHKFAPILSEMLALAPKGMECLHVHVNGGLYGDEDLENWAGRDAFLCRAFAGRLAEFRKLRKICVSLHAPRLVDVDGEQDQERALEHPMLRNRPLPQLGKLCDKPKIEMRCWLGVALEAGFRV